ncbi:MAG: prolyl oligopeptidase family serine peptidase, partial [Gemmatimonadales bacterium]|nr:prolyl oligopeptidase family serine peptidase [Gemmatimonadales bacterium]
SRGGIVTTLALSQSQAFRVGINADTAFFSAGGFFRGGMVREIYRGLFGGSPLDPRYAPAYRAFSPSARADAFAGPLLQMFTGRSAPSALELDQALREAKVPTKLVIYPGETHILHRPRTRLAAMQASLAWLEAWLGEGGHAVAQPHRAGFRGSPAAEASPIQTSAPDG